MPVFIYAADPLSAAGARALLQFEPSIELVGPDIDRARVALIVTDAVDEGLCRVALAVQRDGAPRLAAVASRFTEAGVVSAVGAGVGGFLRRSEASRPRLAELIEEVDSGGGLPRGLLDRAGRAAGCEGAAQVAVTAVAAEDELSDRESAVLRLVADGLDTAEVAEQLSFSESTIKGVLAKVMLRLDARNRSHAVALAVRAGLI